MFEVVWLEINRKGYIVTKRKVFETEEERSKYIVKLHIKESFFRIEALSEY